MAEANGAGAEGARGFSRAMESGSKGAGVSVGRGFSAAFKKSVDVAPALRVLERDVRSSAEALSRARLSEADAAGRVRVAEAQLAEARSKFGAGSSQVIRAEERLASVQRASEVQAAKVAAASERLAVAKAQLAAASGSAARGVSGLSSAFAPLRAQVQGAVDQLGVFYRSSAAMGPVRAAVEGFSKAWTVAKGVVTGLGPVVLAPLGRQVSEVAQKFGAWAKDSALKVPGVGRAVQALSGPLVAARGWFSALGSAGAGVASALGPMFGPVGQQISQGLRKGFDAAVSAAGRAASSIGGAFSSAIGAVATGAVAGLVASLKGGFDRLASVETATAKMRGFGLQASTVTAVMAQVKDSVQGTVYSVGEMGNAAAAAVLAGVAPGAKLESYMALLKNTATAAGAPLNEIQSIFGKIVANVGGPVTTELNQLTDRGIPAWTILAQKMGLSVTEVKKLASEGQITSDVIVEHLGGAMSAMAEEVGGTTVSALQRMRSSFSRFGEALMQESFPGVKAVADAVREVMNLAIALVGPIKQAFGLDEVGPAIEKINAFTAKVREFTAVLTGDGAEGANAIQAIVNRVKELAPVLGLAALAVVPLMGSFLSSLPLIGPMLAGLGSGLLGGLAPLLAGGGLIAMLGMNPESFAGMVMGIVSALSSGFSSLAQTLPGLLAGLVPTIAANLVANAPILLEGMRQLLVGMVQAASTALPAIVTSVISLVPAIVQALVSAIPVLLQTGVQLLLGLVQAVSVAIPQIVSALVAAIPQIVTSIVTALPLIIQGGLQLFMGLLQALVQLIPQLLTAVIELVPVLIGGLISMLPQLILGAMELFLGMVMGLVQAIPQIVTAIITAIPQLITALVSQLPALITGAVQLFLGLVTGLVQAIPQIISAVIGMIPQIVSAIIGAVPQLLSAGRDLVRGLAQGIGNAAGLVMDAIGGVVNGAIDWAKGLLGIKSPSRVFRTIGDQVGQGLSLGLDGAQSGVASAAGRLVDATRSAFEGLQPVEIPVAASFTGAGVQSRFASLSAAGVGREPVTVRADVNVQTLERDPHRIGREVVRGVVEELGSYQLG